MAIVSYVDVEPAMNRAVMMTAVAMFRRANDDPGAEAAVAKAAVMKAAVTKVIIVMVAFIGRHETGAR